MFWSRLIKNVYAQGAATDTPVPPTPNLTSSIQISQITSPGLGWTNLSSVIGSVAKLLMIVAAIATFFYLLLGGLQWITSGGDAKKTEAAGKQITNALIGLGIVAAAWALMLILQQFFNIRVFDGAISIPTPN